MNNLSQICQEVIQVSKDTGRFILSESEKIKNQHIESKGRHDYVTYVDKTAEKRIIEFLRSILPEAGFLAEENTVKYEETEYTWIIDPLDGTTNFIHGLPVYSVSIALMHEKEIVLGVVYEPNLDECFYSFKGGNAYLNGKEISVSGKNKLQDSLLATGFPYHDYSRLQKYLELFTWCLHNTHGVRRIGSAAVDLAYVACGRFEAFFEYGLSPWDVAAGGFILKQAGGLVSDFSGDKDYIFSREIIGTNKLIYDEFLKVTHDKLI